MRAWEFSLHFCICNGGKDITNGTDFFFIWWCTEYSIPMEKVGLGGWFGRIGWVYEIPD